MASAADLVGSILNMPIRPTGHVLRQYHLTCNLGQNKVNQQPEMSEEMVKIMPPKQQN